MSVSYTHLDVYKRQIVLRSDNIALVDSKDIQQVSLLGIGAIPVQWCFNTIQLHQNLLDDRSPELLMLIQTIFVLSYMDGYVCLLYTSRCV